MGTTNISFHSMGKFTNDGGNFIGWKYSKYIKDLVPMKTFRIKKNLSGYSKNLQCNFKLKR